MQPVVVIPTYQPPNIFPSLIDNLIARGVSQIIVVDDGSPVNYQPIFSTINRHDEVTLLRHSVNLGKGQALKTAFNHVLLTVPPTCPGVVTADDDGQHSPHNIVALAAQLTSQQTEVILGVRSFRGKIPARNRFGNILTKHLFRIIIGTKLTDTQTGLRAISLSILPSLLRLPSKRFDYEFEALIYLAKSRVPIRQEPIQTLYPNKNHRSHFKPLADSLRIYSVFIRHLRL